MDGEITIGTSLNTDKFDKQVAQLEKKMQKEESKKIEYEAEINLKEGQIQKAKEILGKIQTETNRVNVEMQDLATQMDSLKIDTPEFEVAQQKLTELQIETKVYQELWNRLPEEIEKQEIKVENLKNKQQEINDKVAEYKQQIESVNLQKQVADVNRIKDGFYGVGSSIQNAIGQAGRLVLGIFSISSAYMGVIQAISTLSQYNSTLANQITAIKLALVSAIEPVVNFIVGVVSKVVSFIGYILKMLFGIDIFARATALSFGKISAGASSASKSVKEIRKQLAGFDEATVLNENGTTGGVGGVGGASDGIKDIGKQLQDLNTDGEKVFKKFRKWFLGSDKKTLKGIWEDNVKIFERTFEPLGNWIDKNVWQPIQDTFGQTMEDLKPYIEPIREAFNEEVEKIKPIWDDLVNNYLKPLWQGFKDFIKKDIVNPLVEAFRPIGAKIYNFLVPYVNNIIDLINNTFGIFGVNLQKWEYKTEETTDNVDTQFSSTMNNIEKSSNTSGKQVEKNINKPLGNVKAEIKDVSRQTLTVDTNTSKIDTFASKLRNIWETLKNIVTGKWEFTLRASGGGGTGSFGYGGGGGYRAHGGIYYPSKLPKLATGGIINFPGRGVPYNGAIIGERGAEAVVPLTDNQQMELLGATIGKYITINANVINTMNGRVISRELKQIKNEQDFAFNN